MNLKTRRMNHIFKEDGKALIVAMDHGTFNGAAPGLEHPGETLQQIAEGGADAVLCNFGVARKFAKELAPFSRSFTGILLLRKRFYDDSNRILLYPDLYH